MKTCSRCKKQYDDDKFINKNGKECVLCNKCRNKSQIYIEKNREKRNEQKKIYVLNKKKIRI